MSSRSALLALLVLAAACSGDGPQPGDVSVVLVGTPDARSVELRLVGVQTGVVAFGADVRVFTSSSGDTTLVIAIADQGHTLQEGPLARITVPDQGAAGQYAVQVLQVAAADYSLKNPVAYAVSIAPID